MPNRMQRAGRATFTEGLGATGRRARQETRTARGRRATGLAARVNRQVNEEVTAAQREGFQESMKQLVQPPPLQVDEEAIAEQPLEAGQPLDDDFFDVALEEDRKTPWPKFRTHIILNDGYKIFQPMSNKYKMPWQEFIKKLLSGRPLDKGMTIRRCAEDITEANKRNSCKAIIRTIKSHGNKFDYAIELTRALNKIHGNNTKMSSRDSLPYVGRAFNTGILATTEF